MVFESSFGDRSQCSRLSSSRFCLGRLCLGPFVASRSAVKPSWGTFVDLLLVFLVYIFGGR